MAISFPLSPPSSPGFRNVRFRLVPNATVQRSPFTQQALILEHQGYHWQGTFTLPRMTNATAREWKGWLAALRGPVGTFLIGDPESAVAGGSNPSSPNAQDPASAGARTMTIAWGSGQQNKTGLLLRGDMFSVGNELKIVTTASVDSDGTVSANSTIDFEPPLRAAVIANQAITTTNPKGLFRLFDQQAAEWASDHVHLHDVSFAIIESL